MPITVGADDVTGLTITTAPSGNRHTAASPQKPARRRPPARRSGSTPRSRASQLQSTVENRPRPSGPGPGGAPLPPFTFRLPIIRGGFSLGVVAPDGWMLKAVEVDNTDMTDRVLDLRGASHDVRVVLTDRVTQLDGTRDGRLAAGTGRGRRGVS